MLWAVGAAPTILEVILEVILGVILEVIRGNFS